MTTAASVESATGKLELLHDKEIVDHFLLWRFKRCRQKIARLEAIFDELTPELTDTDRHRVNGGLMVLRDLYAEMAKAAQGPVWGMFGRVELYVEMERRFSGWHGWASSTVEEINALRTLSSVLKRRQGMASRSKSMVSKLASLVPTPSGDREIDDLHEFDALLQKMQTGRISAESFATQVSDLMSRMKQKMLTLGNIVPPQHTRYMAYLAAFYQASGIYPCSDGFLTWEITDTDLTHHIGHGRYGSCFQGKFLGRHDVVLKYLHANDDDIYSKPRQGVDGESRADFRLRREVEIWKKLNHPHILPFIGLYKLHDTICMVSPRIEHGSAHVYAAKRPDASCLNLLVQVADGLQYLHGLGVIHGDLCGHNILVTAAGDARIADFGLSLMMDEDYPDSNSSGWHLGGNIRWRAPELLRSINSTWPHKTTASDIFSFGRVVLELTTGARPFAEVLNDLALLDIVLSGECPRRPTSDDAMTRGLSDEVWALAKDCWAQNPEERPSAADVFARLQAAVPVTLTTRQ